MDINKILYVATEAGRIILENGGETYRVEETILRICASFGINNCDSFVITTGIMVSVTDKFGQTTSLVKRVKARTVNLEKISAVNDLSRNIKVKGLTADDVKELLIKIENIPVYNKTLSNLCGALAASSFTLLFGGSIKDGLSSLFIGLLLKVACDFMSKYKINAFFINLFGGGLAALFSLAITYFNIGQNLDTIIIGSLMLLVPGLAITNAIRDTIAGDLLAALSRALEAFLIAIGIATGTGTVLKIWFTYIGGF